MALAYSAVQDPAALSSTQSPLAWPLSKIPAVTAPFLRARRSTTSASRCADGQTRQGLDALRRDPAVTPADWPAVARIKGRIERDLAPPRLPPKINKLVGILKRRLTY